MINLNYRMDHKMCQMFKIILCISSKNMKLTNNSLIKIYVNKIEKRIALGIKTGTFNDMKLVGSTKGKVNKEKNGENVTDLEMNDVALIHFNVVNN